MGQNIKWKVSIWFGIVRKCIGLSYYQLIDFHSGIYLNNKCIRSDKADCASENPESKTDN